MVVGGHLIKTLYIILDFCLAFDIFYMHARVSCPGMICLDAGQKFIGMAGVSAT